MSSNIKWGIGLGCLGLMVVPPFLWALYRRLAEYFYGHMGAWLVLILLAAFVWFTDDWFNRRMWALEDSIKARFQRVFRRRSAA